MHLGNMILEGDGVTIFDCIEFNREFRWIDVMNEVAFCTMDLEDRGRPDCANRFINAYLQYTGDYDGLAVLRFYSAYRAMVRAKIAQIRIRQEQLSREVEPELYDELYAYLDSTQRYINPPSPNLLITHGLSSSGKTVGTQSLVESTGAVRIRSDVERKRLVGCDAQSNSHSEVGGGL